MTLDALNFGKGAFDDTVFLGPVDGFGGVAEVVGKGPDRRVAYENRGLSGYFFRKTRSPDRPAFACRGTRYARVKSIGVLGFPVRDASFPKTDERYWGPDNDHAFFEVNHKSIGTEDPASDCGIENVYVGGFCDVIANGIDIEVNGDFTLGRDVHCENVKYLVRSLGGQARSMLLERWIAADVWTAFSNVDRENGTHGQFGGKIETMSFGGFVGRIFEFSNSAVLGPVKIDCLKSESQYRIGDWTGNTASEGSLIFDALNIVFLPRKTMEYGVPANVMGGNNETAIIFNGTDFGGTEVLSMMPPDVRLRDASRFHTILGISQDWQKRAWNAGLGVYCGSTQHDLKATLYTETGMVTNVSTGEFRHPHVTIPYWVERCEFKEDPYEIRVRRPKFIRQKSEFETTVDGLDVTLVWQHSIGGRVTAQEVGFCKGGAMRCDATGQILWIKAVDGSTITAEAMCGHDFTTADVSSDGAWKFIGGGYKSPVRPIWGTFNGTDKVVLSGEPEGLGVGDMIAVSQYRQDFGAAPFIKEIDGNTITLEEPVGFSGEVPLFVWIERDLDMALGLGIGLGVGENTGGASGDHFNDTFDSDTEGWAIQAGSPTLTWVADDSASHDASPQTGSLRYQTDGAGDNIISKSFSVPRNTLMRVDFVVSFGSQAATDSRHSSSMAVAVGSPQL